LQHLCWLDHHPSMLYWRQHRRLRWRVAIKGLQQTYMENIMEPRTCWQF
jgi:hypothetical protein